MNNTNISIQRRLSCMFLDHAIMTFIILIFLSPFLAHELNQEYSKPISTSKWEYYLGIFAMLIYFNKDIFGGQSFAKRIFKLQVVDFNTGLKASIIRCFLRNIFCIIWPLEIIVLLGNTSRRIGDKVAGTKVIYSDY